ncbi:hypothetical protein GW746_01460, partial [Candidatus Saccharibacteria bacterium]|nr:hypothetical protein [Candidatus Saccharibacteria bacterium]
STVAIYASIFTLLISVIAIGYQAPEESTQAMASESVVARTATSIGRPSAN